MRTAAGPGAGGCTLPPYAALILAERGLALAPGEAVALMRPVAVYGPEGEKPIPATCPVQWSTEGAAASVDGAGRLTAAADARPGDSVRVVVRAMGQVERRTVPIIAAGSNPLWGTWRQDPDSCVGSRGPVGELEFRRTGDVLVTYRPFESYVDLTARYTYDAATGRMVWSSPQRQVDNGVLLEATVEMRNDRIVFVIPSGGDHVAMFDNEPREGPCRAVFRPQ
jgi:hypothetical protein